MLRQPVVSSNIRSVGYDSIMQILEIEFHSGGIYQYRGVPESLHIGLMNASSHGKYFHVYIKDRYHYSRIR